MTAGNGSRPDIGELGLRAASSVVDQMLRISQQISNVRWPVTLFGTPDDTEDDGGDSATSASTRASDIRTLRADADKLIELYGDWTRTLLDGFAALAEGTPPEPTDVLELGPVAAGTTTAATAFLHLFEGATAAPPRFVIGDLIAHHGGVLPGACVAAAPAPEADDPPGGARVTLLVAAAVPADVKPGTYHGHLLVADLPEVHLPVRILVVA